MLRDLILLVERPSNGEMKASILFLSSDGKLLLEGAAPSLPDDYNRAIHGIPIGPAVGSCGTAAFKDEPIFVSDISNDPLWADFREVALKHNLRACWSVPIRGLDGNVLGTFANYYHESKEPTERDIQIVEMVAQTASIAIERHRRDVAKARFDEQRELLVRELNHRVKNVFALANSLLVMTARHTVNPADIVNSVQGRLLALSRAHELVQPGLGAVEPTSNVAFEDVVRDILAPYAITDLQHRVLLAGPELRITPDAVTPVALIVHELATNAAKYGSLSISKGLVNVRWKITGQILDIAWIETDGPRPTKPEKSNFGTTLLRRTVESQLGGKITHDWRPEGLVVSLTLPLTALT